MTDTRVCRTCDIEKPIDEFYLSEPNNPRSSRRGACRDCVRASRQGRPRPPRSNLNRALAVTLNFGDLPNFPEAACKGEPQQLWYPPEHLGSGSLVRYRLVTEARRICFTCPHRTDCAEWAIAHPGASFGGMWGGLSPAELTRERARRNNQEDAA